MRLSFAQDTNRLAWSGLGPWIAFTQDTPGSLAKG